MNNEFIEKNVNFILDKINTHGINSLTSNEKEFLDNPENSIYPPSSSDIVNETIMELSSKGIISAKDVISMDEGFELFSIPKKKFKKFFDEYGCLYIGVISDGIVNMLIVSSEDCFDEDDDMTKERYRLYDYLREKIDKCDMILEFDDEDYLEHVYRPRS